MTLNLRNLAAAAALAALAGCSGDHAAVIDSAPEYCSALVEAGADVVVTCFDHTRDLARLEVAFTYGFDCVNLTAEDVGYDAAKGEACLAALRSWSCDQYFWLEEPPPDCYSAFVGQVPDFGACTSPWSCASMRCDLQACGVPGTCMPTAATGEPCAVEPDFLGCRPGNRCSEGTCVELTTPPPAAAPGAPCPDGVCTDAYFCDRSLATPVCVARLADGADCTSGGECGWNAWCDATCQRWPRVGAACTPGQGECMGGAYCTDAGVCAAAPHVGGWCGITDAGEGAPCVDGWCDGQASSCRSFTPLGGDCQVDGDRMQCGFYGACSVDGVCEHNYCGPLT